MTDPQQSQVRRGGTASATAACIIAACAVAAPLAQRWEGYVNHVYLDPAKIPTYCYGETENISKDPGRIYSKNECGTLLRKRMARDYAPKILHCLPQLADSHRRNVFGALIDSSYNAGPSAVCKSPMAANIKVGNWTAACNALPTWYITATYRGKPQSVERMKAQGWRWTGKAWVKTLAGLVHRRSDERKTCLMAA